MLPMRYSLPETIASPLAPRPIGEILPEVLARYGLEPAPIGENGTATQKNNARRQTVRQRTPSSTWHGRREQAKNSAPSRQLPLFATGDSSARQNRRG